MNRDRILWELGDLIATGFLSPKADLLYIGRRSKPFGDVIVSVEDLARIIVGHQTRRRRALQDERKTAEWGKEDTK